MKFTSLCLILLLSAFAYTATTAKWWDPENCPVIHVSKKWLEENSDMKCLSDWGLDLRKNQQCIPEVMVKVNDSWKPAGVRLEGVHAGPGSQAWEWSPKDSSVTPASAILKVFRDDLAKKMANPTSAEWLSAQIATHAACALHMNYHTSAAKKADGPGWVIFDSAGVPASSKDLPHDPKLVANLMARVHSTPTDWAEHWFKYADKSSDGLHLHDKRTNAYWMSRAGVSD